MSASGRMFSGSGFINHLAGLASGGGDQLLCFRTGDGILFSNNNSGSFRGVYNGDSFLYAPANA